MIKRQILREIILFNPTSGLIIEGEGDLKRYFVEGILQRAGAKNQNGRVYPKEVLVREAKNYAKTFIAEKRAYGELDHPDSTVVEAKNASHTVEKLWWKGDDLYGRLELLVPNPSANIVLNILKLGKTLGISSRGMGSVKEVFENDTLEVQDDFELLCWDFVTNPSTHGAFMRLTENKTEIITPKTGYTCTKYCKAEDIMGEILRGL